MPRSSRRRGQASPILKGEQEREIRLVTALRELLAVLNSHRTLAEILEYLLQQTADLLASDACAIYLLEAEHGQTILKVGAARGLPPDRVALRLRIGSPVTGLAVLKRRPVAFADLRRALCDEIEPDGEPSVEERGSHLVVRRISGLPSEADSLERLSRLALTHPAVLAVPLVLQGETRGALSLFYCEPREFSDHDVHLASAFADHAALALENASLRDGAQRRALELETLYRADERMHASLRLQDVLQALVDMAAEMLQADKTSVLLWDADRERLRVQAAHGFRPETIPNMAYPRGEGISTRVATSGVPIAVEDVRLDPRISPRIRAINESESIRSLISVPIKVADQVVGVFNANCVQPRSFTGDEQRLLLALGQRAAAAINNARLYTEADQRLRELETLYRADDALHRSLRLADVLQALVELASDVLQADKTSVLIWDEERARLVPGATCGFRPETVAQMSHAPGDGVVSIVAITGQPVVVPDASQDPRVAHRITGPEDIRSFMHVPITVGTQVFGVFGVNYCQPHQFTAGEQRLLQGLAQRAAVAIQNARLYEEAQQRLVEIERRREVAEALRDLLAVVNSGRSLDAILDHVVIQARRLLGSEASAIYLPAEAGLLQVHASRGLEAAYFARRVKVGVPATGLAFSTRRATAVSDVENSAAAAPDDPQQDLEVTGYQAVLAVPLAVKAETYGALTLYYRERRRFDEEDIALASTFADQAALAIENARLSERAQQAATLEERQRLARELHDAVTQTLFSASLIAEVTPRLWERSPAEGRRRLEELRVLTRGALAEMRALLLELRPGALVETPIGQLLRQLADATSSRARLVVDVRVVGERPLPTEVQVALYRIVQEALNNVIKHAHATRVEVGLSAEPGGLELVVLDDGRGFDPTSVPAGHLGVRIMRERAEAIGAELEVSRHAAGGTQVTLCWRDPTARIRQ
jgi:GAF domain-containing protein